MKSFPNGWKRILSSLGVTKRRKPTTRRRRSFGRIARVATLEERHVLATITVTTVDDVVDQNDGETSLREAVASADIAGGDTIDFDPSAPNMNGGTITLDPIRGQIEFAKSLTIDASMLSNGLTIDGNDPGPQLGNGIRLFNIVDTTSGADPPHVTFIGPEIGLTLKGGKKIRGHSTFCFNDFVTIAS